MKTNVINTINPLFVINAIRETDPNIKMIFTNGSCYRFHLFLKKIWPDAIVVTNEKCTHVGSLIDGEVYDINGIISWSYRAMSDDEIKLAESWSFSNGRMMQIGECPACEEPIVV